MNTTMKLSFVVCLSLLNIILQSCSVDCVNNVNDQQTKGNNRPIIGILAQEYFSGDKVMGKNPSYFPASYVKFVEMGGAQAVPIIILFPGGGQDIMNSSYAAAANILYKLALEANNKGDYFPLWGTCLGFELLTALTSDKFILTKCNANDMALSLNLTKDSSNSAMFGSMPVDVLYYLSMIPTTVNYHSNCVTPQNFTKFGLDKFYRVLSTNRDAHSLEYISAIEGINYPFYGVQFHPEKNSFEWIDRKGFRNIPHNWESIRVTQYLAAFFVEQARKNSHRFPSSDVENSYLIYNYKPVFSGPYSEFTQMYLFPY